MIIITITIFKAITIIAIIDIVIIIIVITVTTIYMELAIASCIRRRYRALPRAQPGTGALAALYYYYYY